MKRMELKIYHIGDYVDIRVNDAHSKDVPVTP